MIDAMSWKKLRSRTVFENDWMEVREDHVINPGGGENLYGHVHFKNRAVAIIPLDPDNNVWLVGQQRYTLDAWSWELPMGGAPLDEVPLEAAKRELKEETGLCAGHWTEIMRLHPSNSITDEVGIIYLARQLTHGEPDFEETEDLEIRKLPLIDALAMIGAGEITDAISVAALLFLSPDFDIPQKAEVRVPVPCDNAVSRFARQRTCT
jgi:8-oxo-dGTP pyrophosphatase MutT (NUDIX family)